MAAASGRPGVRRVSHPRPLATIARQFLERGPIDEIDLQIAPVLLGDGIRLFDHPPGGVTVPLEVLNGEDPWPR